MRKHWPKRMGEPPKHMLSGVPDHVDGRMLEATGAAGGRIINSDRMWHYPEGIDNYAPIWSRHGIRVLSGPSPLWLDATGRRLPVPLFPGFDCYGALEHVLRAGHDHSWFLLNERIIGREFALSGSEQNPDFTNKSILGVLRRGRGKAMTPVQKFVQAKKDFVVAKTLPELVEGMNRLTQRNLVDAATVEREVVARDRELDHKFGKDAQIMAIRAARKFIGDRVIRVMQAAQAARSRRGSLDRGPALGADAQDPGRARDRSRWPRAGRRRRALARRLCGRRGRRLRRRRRARLSRAGRHVPRRLPVLRPHRGPGGGQGGRMSAPIKTSDGVELFVRDWPVPAGARRRGSALIIHGLGEHSGRYAHVAAALNEIGIAVRGYDQRGFGQSGGPRATIPSLNALLDDAKLVFDAFAAEAQGRGRHRAAVPDRPQHGRRHRRARRHRRLDPAARPGALLARLEDALAGVGALPDRHRQPRYAEPHRPARLADPQDFPRSECRRRGAK